MHIQNTKDFFSNSLTRLGRNSVFPETGSVSKIQLFMQKTGKSFLGKAAIIAPTISLKGLSLKVVCRNASIFLGTVGLVCAVSWMVFHLINSGKFSGFSLFNKNSELKNVSQNLVDEEPSKVLNVEASEASNIEKDGAVVELDKKSCLRNESLANETLLENIKVSHPVEDTKISDFLEKSEEDSSIDIPSENFEDIVWGLSRL